MPEKELLIDNYLKYGSIAIDRVKLFLKEHWSTII